MAEIEGPTCKLPLVAGGALYAVWSNNGSELSYEATDDRIMVVDYTATGASLVPGKRRLWSNQRLFSPGTSKFDLAPDGKRILAMLPDLNSKARCK